MKTLLKISLSISLIGLLALLILSNILQPKPINIKEINHNFLNQKIQTQGTIINIKSYKEFNFQIITIKDKTGKIDITLDKILNLKKNQAITILGTIKEYKDNLQIQADKITFSLP